MTTWPIGLSTGCFYQTSIFDCLETIRESGFSMIEVCFAPAHLDYHDLAAVHRAAARIDELGMEAYSFHAPFASHLDISSLDAGEREAARAEIFLAVEAAAILQVHYFVIHPGPESEIIPPQSERLRRMENVVEVLNRVAQRCQELGIECVLENKLPHLLFGKTSDILWILDALDSVNVGVCLDTGHASFSGDIHSFLQRLTGHLKMIHAHDNGGHFDDHLPPGDGRIHWERLLSELGAGGFRGAFILELASAADSAVTMANARRGRAHLRRISRRLALAKA
ncbi:MAG: sugar phosphate isomerase/epimerase [Terrimicrobiaceae bacterium]|nr:sugar phosphate isomerase/epimerase [Terrimicrobiaceae bacterium]